MAAALALTVRGNGPPVVLLWRGVGHTAPAGLPASRAARRVASALASRGLSAAPFGRAVRVILPDPPLAAAAAARRAAAAARGAVVLSVAGPRARALDDLLPEVAAVAYAGDGRAALAELVIAELAAAGLRVHVAAPLSAAASLLARAGLVGPASMRRWLALGPAERGQALLAMLGGLLAVVAGAVVVGWLAAAVSAHGAHQRAADLAALAGARALLDARPRVLAPGVARLAPAAYLALAGEVARRTARRNGARQATVTFGAGALPDTVRVVVHDRIAIPGGTSVAGQAAAEAQIAAVAAPIGDGTYAGPLALRQGKPMRPDVALAFDRLAAAARRDAIALTVVSAFRSSTEQARLFAAHPDPKWVAPPGRSLHRLGTELDLGPASAYRWLAEHAGAYGFVRRYSWEPWHFGYGRSPGSASVGLRRAASGVPAFVPAQYRAALRAASQRWSVGAALLAAQLEQESGLRSGLAVAAPERSASRSSCRGRRAPTGCATRWTPRRRSMLRRT